MKKQFLAVLLTLAMLLSILPTSALAAEGGEDGEAPVVYTETGEDPEGDPTDIPSELGEGPVEGVSDPTVTGPEQEEPAEEPTAVGQLQARINDLPDADALAGMDKDEQAEVYAEVCAISDAIDELTTEEADALDTAKLEAAAAFFTQQIMTLGGTEDGEDTEEAPAPASNSCGATDKDTVTWALTDDDNDGKYTLTISGTGAMRDYNDPTSTVEGAVTAPWYSALTPDTNKMVPITKIVVGDGITGLGNYAFAYTSVTEVEFMPNVSDYGRNLFAKCLELTTVDWTNFYPKNLKDDSVTNGATGQIVPTSLFDGCVKLANSKLNDTTYEGELVLPSYITGICLSGFYGTAFTTVDLQEQLSNVKSIGPYAFSNTKITSVYIPADVEFYETNGGTGAHFAGCTSLANVTVDEEVTKIPHRFLGNTAISNIELGAVTSIGKDAFLNCTNLKTVTIEGSADLVIVNEVFNETNGKSTPVETFVLENGSVAVGGLARLSDTLKNLTMSGTTVSQRMFYQWKALENVILKEGITSIGNQAFYDADNLKIIVLPSTLESISTYAIQNCNSLEVVDMTAVKSVTVGQYALSKSGTDVSYAQGIIYVSNADVENALATQDGVARYSYTASAIANTNGGYFEEVPTSGTTLATPVKDGYTFDGWYSSSDFTGEKVTATAKTSGKYPTYYAKWNSEITFNANGGSGTMAAQTIGETDTSTTLTENTYTREGYEFSGWNTAADGSGTSYANKATGAGANGNITLYAQWTMKIGDSTNYTMNAIVDQTYTGEAIEPAVVVKSGDTVLDSGYTVSYSNNTDVGTAKVTVAVGSDKAEVEFKIVKDTSPTVEMADVSVTYGTEYTMTATAKTSAGNEITDGTITIKYYTDESCTEGETSTVPTNAGTYYAKATLTGTDNYAEATKTAKIEISNATFSVTATGYSGTYDGQAHSITVAAEGASVTYSTDGTNYSETNPTFTNAGTYNVYYKASKANHNDVTGSVSVEISKATLIITAANQTIYVGGTLPTAYTYTVSGLVGEDTESIITTQPTMACSAADANTAGTYTITASSANAGENYTITYVDGTLTIATVETGEAFKVEVNKGFDTVPTGLSSKYNTVGDLTSDLKTKITTANSSVSASNIVVYDVTLMVNLNDGNGWVNADATHFPANGRLTITLPYPEGTNSNYKFTVVHMFTTSDFGRTPGDTETPNVTNTSSGLQFSVTGLSPISVGWTAPTSGGSSHSGGGSSSSSSYTVTVDSAKNGTVKADRTSASKGTTVTLTVTPKDGYELDSLTVTDKNGDTVKLTRKSDTQYTFTMPASKVTVEASFTKIAEQPKVSFVDVPTSAYYYDAVAWAVENGVTAGTSATTFSPDASCTRAQAVTFLWRAAGSPAPKSSVNPFADVPASAYYYDAVLWAVEQGITAGTSATTFSPDATCTRAQIVTFLYRADGTATTSNNPFVDVADSAYYANAVKWAVSEGVTAGTSATTFSPDAFCTRAQIVTFLYRAYA